MRFPTGGRLRGVIPAMAPPPASVPRRPSNICSFSDNAMIASAKEKKTVECELYISFRKPNSKWSVPVSLGVRPRILSCACLNLRLNQGLKCADR